MSSQTLMAGLKVPKAKLMEGLSLQQTVQPVAITSGRFPRPRSDKRCTGLTFLVVAMLHASGSAWLITRTTEYTPLSMVTPQKSATIRASVVEYNEPPPQVVKQTPVLTAERGEREVAQTLNKPAEIAPPPVAAIPVVHTQPPKQIVKKTHVAKPVEQKPVTPTPKLAQSPAQSVTPAASMTLGEPIAGRSSGRMMQTSSSAQPKNVAAIGCAVPEPEYPRRALRLKQEGEVLVRLVINPQGHLTHYEIARSSGFEALDQAALAAVQKTSCMPYIENGQPIAVMTLQPVNFRLGR